MKNGNKSPLSALRTEHQPKLTQRGIAEKIGCTEKTYRSWENGDGLPNTHDLVELAKLFDVSTDFILGLSNFKRIEYEDVSRITGLSEASINTITHPKRFDAEDINTFIESDGFENIMSCLFALRYRVKALVDDLNNPMTDDIVFFKRKAEIDLIEFQIFKAMQNTVQSLERSWLQNIDPNICKVDLKNGVIERTYIHREGKKEGKADG